MVGRGERYPPALGYLLLLLCSKRILFFGFLREGAKDEERCVVKDLSEGGKGRRRGEIRERM